jgi:hypothetical protein
MVVPAARVGISVAGRAAAEVDVLVPHHRRAVGADGGGGAAQKGIQRRHGEGYDGLHSLLLHFLDLGGQALHVVLLVGQLRRQVDGELADAVGDYRHALPLHLHVIR